MSDDRALTHLLASLARNTGHRSVDIAAIRDLLHLGGCLFMTEADAAAAIDALLRRIASLRPGRLFDPVEIVGMTILDGLGGGGDFWRRNYVATGRRLVTDLTGGVRDLAALPPRRFEIALSRTFALPAVRPTRLRLPLPVEDAHLSDLSVTVEQAPGPVRIDQGRLEVKAAGGAARDATIAVRLTFVAHAGISYDDGSTAADRALWLATREAPIDVTPSIRLLSAQLGGGDVEEKLHCFRDHLFGVGACGPIHPDRIRTPATDWILDQGWFDCRLGAAVLIALCRPAGIPARLVGGYLLWAAPTEHYWAEVWMPGRGWAPWDLLSWDLSAGGRDPDWRDIYTGAIDYRMKTQIFPNSFTGAPGIAMGNAWHRLTRAIDRGTETRFVSIPDGRPLYSETIRILGAG